MSEQVEIELVSCQNCGHEWEPNEETHCPLCRWRLSNPIRTVFGAITVKHILGDKPLRLPPVKVKA